MIKRLKIFTKCWKWIGIKVFFISSETDKWLLSYVHFKILETLQK
jgi:hypothetical protein